MSDEHTTQTAASEQQESSDEQVRALGEDRYVVSVDEEGDPLPTDETPDRQPSAPGSDPEERIADLEGAYALDLAARHGSEGGHLRHETNDVTEAFESLLRWYADRVAPDTPPETAVATLLANSDLDVDGRGRAGSDSTTR